MTSRPIRAKANFVTLMENGEWQTHKVANLDIGQELLKCSPTFIGCWTAAIIKKKKKKKKGAVVIIHQSCCRSKWNIKNGRGGPARPAAFFVRVGSDSIFKSDGSVLCAVIKNCRAAQQQQQHSLRLLESSSSRRNATTCQWRETNIHTRPLLSCRLG